MNRKLSKSSSLLKISISATPKVKSYQPMLRSRKLAQTPDDRSP